MERDWSATFSGFRPSPERRREQVTTRWGRPLFSRLTPLAMLGIIGPVPHYRQARRAVMVSNPVSAVIRKGLFTRIVGRRFLYYQEVASTMDDARRLAEEGAGEGAVVMAENQTSGRGRFGRNWVSGQGNIHLSALFRPSMDVLPQLTMICAVAVCRAIRKTTALDPRVKWPNDVLVDDRKVSGILIEAAFTGDRVDYAIAGIGVNISLDTSAHEEIAGAAGCLDALTGGKVARDEVLRQLLMELDALYVQARQGDSPLEEWRSLVHTVGRRVTVSWRDDAWEGLAEDVDASGNLLLRLDDGQLVTMTAGDVSMRPSPQSA